MSAHWHPCSGASPAAMLLATRCNSHSPAPQPAAPALPCPQMKCFLNISSNSAHEEGAHGIDHRRSLRLVEAQGHMALRTSRPVGPPDVLEVGARPPAEIACGVDADASPTPQARIQHLQALNPVACFSSSRRKRYRYTPCWPPSIQIQVPDTKAAWGSVFQHVLSTSKR